MIDPFQDLEKRERLALRQARERGSASAPRNIVTKLEKLGLVIKTGHFHEPQEWGKVIRKEPIFFLTDEGERIADMILAALSKPLEGSARARTKRVSAGYYIGTYQGKDFEIVKVEGHAKWYWFIPSKNTGGEDWFDYKSDAIDAVEAWIDENS